MHEWKSVKPIQYYCGSLDFTRLCDLGRLRFLHKMAGCQNVALNECFSRIAVSNRFEEYIVNFSLSLYAVNGAVYSKFASICGM